MPKFAKLSDAELVERLRFIKEHGTTKAAELLGVGVSSLRQSRRDAKAKGLTADSVVEANAEERLRTQLKIAEGEIKRITKANETADAIRKELYGLASQVPAPPTWLTKKRPAGLPGVPMAMWSDWHYGEVVRKEEVGGVNEFDRAIAKQRIQRLVNVTLDLALHHMVKPQYPGIVICLGGDMVSGNIHEELTQSNDGPINVTLLELQEQLIAAISTMADNFGNVFVPCVVGNHGRMTQKPRMKGRVYENYEWNLYCQLERWFKSSAKYSAKVRFLVPGETDAYFNVLGHRFLLTHGDTLGVKGGDGIIGALGPIARGAFKVGRSEAQIGRDFDTIVMGHWHTYIPRGEAIPAIVNGTLKGYDEFARLALRVPYSRPSQALWFVHEGHGITAQWQVYLDGRRQAEQSASWVEFLKAN
jgi:hypothetical protein